MNPWAIAGLEAEAMARREVEPSTMPLHLDIRAYDPLNQHGSGGGEMYRWTARPVAAAMVDFRFGIGDASVMEALDALKTANGEFESRLRSVESQHWNLPTPCAEWDVRTLVNHMLLGTRMSVQVLAGMPREEVIAGLDDDLMPEGVDPVAAFVDLSNQMVEGFSGPKGLEGVVAHPAGDFPRSMFVGFRVTDSAAHAWDLATAVGLDTSLNAEMIQFLWDDAAPKREMLVATGMFGEGPSGSVEDDAALQTRYLDLIGRRP